MARGTATGGPNPSRPPTQASAIFHRGLTGAILLGVAVLSTGCGAGSPATPASSPSVPVEAGGESTSAPLIPESTVTTAGAMAVPSAGTGEHGATPSPSAPSTPSTAVDLTEIDALLTDIDTQLSEADHDLATPEGDF